MPEIIKNFLLKFSSISSTFSCNFPKISLKFFGNYVSILKISIIFLEICAVFSASYSRICRKVEIPNNFFHGFPRISRKVFKNYFANSSTWFQNYVVFSQKFSSLCLKLPWKLHESYRKFIQKIFSSISSKFLFNFFEEFQTFFRFFFKVLHRFF